jgi:hypothetical protein
MGRPLDPAMLCRIDAGSFGMLQRLTREVLEQTTGSAAT